MGYAKPGGYNNNKHMYLALVLTGQYTSGHAGLIVPPKDPNRPDTSFDSVTGHGGSIFVVFYDSQCYPEYLITFQ
jgi:poly [ADP-ribose] polymerase 10/14/15